MTRSNILRTLFLSLSLTAGAFAAPAYAQTNINVSLAPPAPQYEAVPTIPSGYVWAPGYWGWTGERHVWVRGRTIAQRDGYRWRPDRWDERDHRYYHTAGYWQRDDDHHDKGKHKGWDKDHDKGDKGEKGEKGHKGGKD